MLLDALAGVARCAIDDYEIDIKGAATTAAASCYEPCLREYSRSRRYLASCLRFGAACTI